MSEMKSITYCRDCIHRPLWNDEIAAVVGPRNKEGIEDLTCPCLCYGDAEYNYIPMGDFFCAKGEPRGYA